LVLNTNASYPDRGFGGFPQSFYEDAGIVLLKAGHKHLLQHLLNSSFTTTFPLTVYNIYICTVVENVLLNKQKQQDD
jgi:hypothetical protein